MPDYDGERAHAGRNERSPSLAWEWSGPGEWTRDDAPPEGWGAVYGPGRYGLGPYYERLRQHRLPDEEILQNVREVLFFDTWVDAPAITVAVHDGVVTLGGELPNHDEIRYATDDVWDVDGVRGVISELVVRAG